MAKIQEFINNRHKYKVDLTYQRPAGAWSTQDNQCLIDSLLKGEPVPLFFINEKTEEGFFYVVDGQQRLHAIKLFYDNKLKLNQKFSGEENHGKTFNGENPISDDQRETFLNYTLKFHMLEDYDDERIRLIFSRLQRGKQLTLGERLNANPGNIVLSMREIAKHPFMGKSVGISKERYGAFPDAARILFYEKYGQKDCGTPAIYSFFDNNSSLSKESKEYRNALKILNFLRKCFPEENYQFLSKHAWVFAVYTMIRELSLSYSLIGKEETIKKFIENFHNKVYSEDRRQSNPTYQRFYDNVRGGWSEKIIALRRNLLIREFLDKHELEELDEKRQISDEEKIATFEKHPNCELCNCSFKDYKEPEYHHRVRHVDGGKSEMGNIVVLCDKCHDRIHGKEKIELPTEDEIEENE
jgi:5-methylcytosine-specific restriction endonuclease McrA